MPRPKFNGPPIQCKECGEPFDRNIAEQKFCSPKCKRDYHKYGSSFVHIKAALDDLVTARMNMFLLSIEESINRRCDQRIEDIARSMVDHALRESEDRKHRALLSSTGVPGPAVIRLPKGQTFQVPEGTRALRVKGSIALFHHETEELYRKRTTEAHRKARRK